MNCEIVLEVFIEFYNFIKELNPDIILGDFNAEAFIDMMDYTRDNYIKTIDVPTKYDGKKFDNILLKNNNYSSKIIKSLSDHFMIVSEIEI